MKKHTFSSKKKDRKKAIRSVVQGMILVYLLYIIALTLFSPKKYIAFNNSERTQRENGFIAISYFGVDRIGTETLISEKNLENHIKALKASGYVTITQEDIKDYYLNGKLLPPKSLFLIFEDGRRDTGIFAQKVLEKYNYKASILSYAQNLETKSPKFLSPKDLNSLQKSGFWEIGTNGYRLSYINVFDRHGNFFDRLDTNEYQMLSSYLDRNYNHYLMDYIRDEYGIPTEDFDELENRISYDYKMIRDIYKDSIGKTPKMYALMHSNTGKFGTNENASSVNEKWIEELFDMNFNREGNCSNLSDASIYDLSRLQPQAYWSTNHLLMSIWDDTGQDLDFVSGDLDKKKDWDTLFGESEFVDDTIILTSLPRDKGLMFLKDSEGYKDFSLSLSLNGNKAGSQTIYLRSDKDLNQYISIEISNNILYIYEKKSGGTKEELFTLDLDIHDGIIPQSMEENKLESEIKYIETKTKYTDDAGEAKELKLLLNEKKHIQTRGVGEGADEYIPRIDLLEQSSRLMDVELKSNLLSLYIDDKKVVKDMEVFLLDPGYVGLEASFNGYGYSQRNLTDDIYDGIFKEITIEKVSSKDTNSAEILYTNKLTGLERFKYKVNTFWERVINWFIKYL